jgi:YVTN family beta-propeller protein
MPMSRILYRQVAASATLLLASSAHAQLAYVANEKSGTLSIIDTTTDRVIGDIPAGKKPRGMALSRDGGRLYVTTSRRTRCTSSTSRRAGSRKP